MSPATDRLLRSICHALFSEVVLLIFRRLPATASRFDGCLGTGGAAFTDGSLSHFALRLIMNNQG